MVIGAGCSQALVWPWAPAAVRAEAVPALTDGAFLLAHLNEALTRTALLVQPLCLGPGVSGRQALPLLQAMLEQLITLPSAVPKHTPAAPSLASTQRVVAHNAYHISMPASVLCNIGTPLTAQELRMVDVPLPLASPPGAAVTGVMADGGRVQVPPPPRLARAVQALGLSKAVGYLRMLQVMV